MRNSIESGHSQSLKLCPFFHLFSQIERKNRRLRTLEKVPEDLQALTQVQLLSQRRQLRQMSDKVAAHAFKIGARLPDVFLCRADRNVSLLHDAAAAGHFGEQHLIVFPAEVVQTVPAHRQKKLLFKFRAVQVAVADGDLGTGARIQRVQKRRIVEKHPHLFFLARDLIVDVSKGVGLGKQVPQLENTVLPDTADGDGILHRARDAEFLFFSFACFDKGLDDRHPTFPEKKYGRAF